MQSYILTIGELVLLFQNRACMALYIAKDCKCYPCTDYLYIATNYFYFNVDFKLVHEWYHVCSSNIQNQQMITIKFKCQIQEKLSINFFWFW